VREIEENAAELLMAMGAAGGGAQRDDGQVRWTIGGSPIDYHNAVVAADLSATEADTMIAESVRLLTEYDVPGSWHVGPSMRPDNLGDRLVAAGFTHAGGEAGMAVKLSELRAPAVVPGLHISRVDSDDALAAWEATLGRGFGEGEKEARWVAEVYRRLGLADPWRHYLGWLNGEPVATTTIYFAAGVAGVLRDDGPRGTPPRDRSRDHVRRPPRSRGNCRVRRPRLVTGREVRVRRPRISAALHHRPLRVPPMNSWGAAFPA
jgi:hypothetical protein